MADVDIDNARSTYQNSTKEQRDIEREFCTGKGSMTHILNNFPFMRIEDEPRVNLLKKFIADVIPAHKIKKFPKK